MAKQLRKTLFPEKRLFFTYRANNISNRGFGYTYPVEQYSYAGAFPLDIYYDIYSQDENHSCYDLSKWGGSILCFDVLTTVPEDSPLLRYKSLRIKHPEVDYFPFWEQLFPCPICFN